MSIQLLIKKPKSFIKPLEVLGILLVIFGTGLFVNNGSPTSTLERIMYLTPIFVGAIILFVFKFYYPLEISGGVNLSEEAIEFNNKDEKQIIPTKSLTTIQLKLGGGYMTARKDWTPLSRDIFPFVHGHENELILIQDSGDIIKTPIFINSRNQEKQIKRYIKMISESKNISLIIEEN